MSDDRERLKDVCFRIYQAACRAIDDPKNAAKGDGWGEMTWTELRKELEKENTELALDCVRMDFADRLNRPLSDPNPEAEGGDCLAYIAMMIDKSRRGGGGLLK